MDEDYPAGTKSKNLSVNEAIDVAQNRPLETDVYIWCYALLVVHTRKDEEQQVIKTIG